MPIESANYIDQLVPSQPQGGESISEGDDHLRVIKNAVIQSFPNIGAAVTSTPSELNAVGKTANDLGLLEDVVEALIEGVGNIDTNSHGNVASVYYKNGTMLYKHNVGSVGKVPQNSNATRITFSPPLDGDSPDHFAFSVTPVTTDNVGRPILITVSGLDRGSIDFIAAEFNSTSGDWTYLEGGTVDFSLLVTDMESGQ